MRLGPAHLPRAREDRARLHDRPRVRGHGGRGGRRRHRGRRGRPRARLLLHGLRQVLLLPPRRLPQVRRGSRVRPRRDARLAPGRAGRPGARPPRQPDAAARARRHVRRRGPVRRRRDGHRLPRGRPRPACEPGDTVAVLGLGPGGPVRRAGRQGRRRRAGDRDRHGAGAAGRGRAFGAEPVHLTEEDPRAAVKAATDGRGVDVAVDAVGHPDALDLACRAGAQGGHGVAPSASTPSASRCTWASSGSRR